MSDILLVHGSCHGAWCWDLVIPALKRLGVTARAIDLPGRSESRVTLDDHATAILAALDGPTLVVGHSAAGYAITAAAARDGASIAGLVYLCAYLPVPDMSLAEMRRAGPRQPLRPAIRLAEDGTSFRFDPGLAGELLFHDCSADLARAAIARLCAEPVAPQETRLALTLSPTLPRHYIICTEDRAIPPDYQAVMASNLPAGRVSKLATGHSPFLVAPEALADQLAQILQDVRSAG